MRRRPSIAELVEECCSLTRWRMTDEVKEILEKIKSSKKNPSKATEKEKEKEKEKKKV